MSTAKHDKDTSNSTKPTDNDTRKVINQTFDDAKNKARKAIDETHKELPRYMQTITDNQEQTVNAARDIIDNYIESQRDITNSFQNTWSSFFDNYLWISPKKITETYARAVSSISDGTIAAIRIWNGTILSSTETMRISTQHMRDNARETSKVVVNGAKMLEEATYLPNVTIGSNGSIENRS
jgi:vacuolar-type H+-ATPase subunit H